MRRTIIYVSLVGSLAIFCLATDIFDSLFMFLLFGVVPGKAEALSAQEMLAFYSSICALFAIPPLHKRLNNLPSVDAKLSNYQPQ